MDRQDIEAILLILVSLGITAGLGYYVGNQLGHEQERKLLTPYFKQELEAVYYQGYNDMKDICQQTNSY